MYTTTPNTLTLRSDFAAIQRGIDVLVNDTRTAISATRVGNTWIIPQPLSSYPKGTGSNAWRIRLAGVPPAGVTYHTSMMQTFVREEEIAEGLGRTYPPTTRR